ncbi:hypothetical protein ACJIZ3_024090 [Penstemon smallii]|uniref:Uncharacterized protein n=1 Tax=Penstemon smallii TaxID=265156 RepID=A0ABD3TQU6_9LAMI
MFKTIKNPNFTQSKSLLFSLSLPPPTSSSVSHPRLSPNLCDSTTASQTAPPLPTAAAKLKSARLHRFGLYFLLFLWISLF